MSEQNDYDTIDSLEYQVERLEKERSELKRTIEFINHPHTELLKESDALKARVMELESDYKTLREFLNQQPVDCFGSNYSDTCGHWPIRDEVIHNMTTIIDRQPPQSLEAHDNKVAARALESFAEPLGFTKSYSGHYIYTLAVNKAAKLRAGGEKG